MKFSKGFVFESCKLNVTSWKSVFQKAKKNKTKINHNQYIHHGIALVVDAWESRAKKKLTSILDTWCESANVTCENTLGVVKTVLADSLFLLSVLVCIDDNVAAMCPLHLFEETCYRFAKNKLSCYWNNIIILIKYEFCFKADNFVSTCSETISTVVCNFIKSVTRWHQISIYLNVVVPSQLQLAVVCCTCSTM